MIKTHKREQIFNLASFTRLVENASFTHLFSGTNKEMALIPDHNKSHRLLPLVGRPEGSAIFISVQTQASGSIYHSIQSSSQVLDTSSISMFLWPLFTARFVPPQNWEHIPNSTLPKWTTTVATLGQEGEHGRTWKFAFLSASGDKQKRKERTPSSPKRKFVPFSRYLK